MSDNHFKFGGIGIAEGGILDGTRVYYSSLTDKCWVIDPESPYYDGDKTFVVSLNDYYACYDASRFLESVKLESD